LISFESQKRKPADFEFDGISIFTNGLFSKPIGFLVSNGSPVVTFGGGVEKLVTL
jgi:hypothetical protein